MTFHLLAECVSSKCIRVRAQTCVIWAGVSRGVAVKPGVVEVAYLALKYSALLPTRL